MLFTGHGDEGYTNIIGGPALLKCDVRLEAVGALDEAQSYLGLARALLVGTAWAEPIKRVQDDMRLLMAECATVTSKDSAAHYISADHVRRLEDDLCIWDALIGGFRGFTTPGETVPGAHLHLARTVVRRAERQVVILHRKGQMSNSLTLTYLNRLSSWVYALALMVEASADVSSLGLAV
jgi:cob(I)alamin adenosyltransferase